MEEVLLLAYGLLMSVLLCVLAVYYFSLGREMSKP